MELAEDRYLNRIHLPTMERYTIPVIGIIGLLVVCTHPLWHYIAVVFSLGVILYTCVIFASDGDVLLMMYEKFGKKADVFRDRVVWITGASSGIGECLAVALAKQGAKLILSSRREKELERVKVRCLEEGSLKSADVLVVVMDANKFDTHNSCVNQALQHFSKIDILINNSGVSQRSEVQNATLETDQFILNTNLIGCISLTKCILPHMMEQKTGHIINISSIAGKVGNPCSATYSASKFGMNGYFDSFRGEVYPYNIFVTNVCPGPVSTKIVENAVQDVLGKEPVKNYDGYAERSLTLIQSGERCAELTLVAAANRLCEIWIARPPFLILIYMAQYMPTCHRFLTQKLGYRKVLAFRKIQQA